uniref:Uncharacterized protein n=1 Tax=Anopheles stephensi TaxID=30069 RepID=A0A182YTD7_ANOST
HATAAGARHTPDTFVRELAAATHNGVPGRQPRDRSGTSRAVLTVNDANQQLGDATTFVALSSFRETKIGFWGKYGCKVET